jgi:hypothetical protein
MEPGPSSAVRTHAIHLSESLAYSVQRTNVRPSVTNGFIEDANRPVLCLLLRVRKLPTMNSIHSSGPMARQTALSYLLGLDD